MMLAFVAVGCSLTLYLPLRRDIPSAVNLPAQITRRYFSTQIQLNQPETEPKSLSDNSMDIPSISRAGNTFRPEQYKYLLLTKSVPLFRSDDCVPWFVQPLSNLWAGDVV